MPLEENYVNHANRETLLRYLPQLLRLDLNRSETDFVQYGVISPEHIISEDHVRTLRSLIMRNRQRLEPLALAMNISTYADRLNNFNLLEYRRLTENTWNEIVAPDAFPEGELPDIDFYHHIERPRVGKKRKKSWELSFMEDKEETDFPKLPQQYLSQVEPEDEREPNLPSTTTTSLEEIAVLIPPGILGIQFETSGAPFALVFRPEREDDPRRKLLDGHGWFEVKHHTAVLWAVATLEAYNLLYETGLEFKVTPKVKRWYDYITSNDPLPSVRYRFKGSPLFDFQEEAVRFLVRRKRAMLAFSPGLGKTLTSAYAASLLPYVDNILLVCPASLLHYWHSELAKWSNHLNRTPLAEIWHRETGVPPEELPGQSQFWAITNPETVTRFTDEFMGEGLLQGWEQPWDLMIVDESIMYKHRNSKRSSAINRLAKSIPDVWLLTGAPATRYLDDMWHQFHILNSRGYNSYWRFADRYCVVDETVWAKSVVANKRDAEEDIKENFKDVYFARSQEQVADIPDWLMEDMDIPMTIKQEKIYTKLQEELEVEIGDREDNEVLTVDNRLSLVLRSIQIASNPVLLGAENTSGKWAVLPELMEIYPGPYLVWVNFIRTGEMLQESLCQKFGVARVKMANGSTPMAERQALVNDFQAGTMDVLVLNSTVGKFGFTLTKARTSFFMERGYDDSYFQCLYRNRRIGTTQSPVVVNMRSVWRSGNRTIDHVVHDALDYRNNMIKKITIGDLREVMHDD